jgi:putative phosphoribosyl transferase
LLIEAKMKNKRSDIPQDIVVYINSGRVILEGILTIPKRADSIVIFAHGSGSSRHSPRNRYVARVLNESSTATLLIDLLNEEEEYFDLQTRKFRFDIPLLAKRLVDIADWVHTQPGTEGFSIGYFGSSTGAAAALIAAAQRPDYITAVVSRGGRPDLAGVYLGQVKTPTLLIVGERDTEVIGLNEEAMKEIKAIKELKIVPNATHLFEEVGTLEIAAELADEWFKTYLDKNTSHSVT